MEFTGYSLIRDPRNNKGTSFTLEERQKYGLEGILPDAVETIETQILRVHGQLNSIDSSINKYIYLANLLDSNETLFFKTIISDPAKFLPLVYTPTVGEACQRFGHIARRPRDYLFPSNKRIISNQFWPAWESQKISVRLLKAKCTNRNINSGYLGMIDLCGNE
jgi:malate dehydrogenase (oxaloacetate-decarboxylating)(NADP+)